MAVSTYNAIGSVTLSSAQASFTFSNIPQIYTDLILVISNLKTATGGYAVRCNINGDTSSNYTYQDMTGYATTASSTYGATDTGGKIAGYAVGTDTTTPQTIITEFANYANNNTYKSFLSRFSGWVPASGEVDLVSLRWNSTAAITSLTITTGGVNISAGTTFNLYGVGANQLKAAGGDIIVSDGSYWYHAFKSSGTFTPNSTLSCDVLVVAGGGSGSSSPGGGGGAGGYRSTTALSVSSATTVTVGAGGVMATLDNSVKGSNSTFSTITSTGGGGGGNYANNTAAQAGGSGGGGGSNNGTYYAGGAGNQGGFSPVEGYAGGTPSASGGGNYAQGGGGGAAAVGGGGTGSTSGNGGSGSNAHQTWLSVLGLGQGGYLAGGGGGGFYPPGSGTSGNPGDGGGGYGSSEGYAGGNGAVNTGGGGGGAGGGGVPGGRGGSGLVIVRYAI